MTRKQYLASACLAVLLILALVAALLPQDHPDAKPDAFIAGFVLFMVPGLAFFCGGMVSKRSVISTMLQSFISLGVISLETMAALRFQFK